MKQIKDYHYKVGDEVTLSDYFIECYVVADDDGTDLKKRREEYGNGKKFKIKTVLSSIDVHGYDGFEDGDYDDCEYYYIEGMEDTIFIYPEDFISD
jgi:hypothetical protein